MVEMKDVGEKSTNGPVCCKEGKDKLYYPSLFLSSKQVPGLKGKKSGDKGTFLVDYVIESSTIRDEENKEKEE